MHLYKHKADLQISSIILVNTQIIENMYKLMDKAKSYKYT